VQYRPCDLCGCLLQVSFERSHGESLICGECLQSRRVKPVDASAHAKHPKHTHKFRCPHCGRKLRSIPVPREVRLNCPSCEGSLILEPSGEVRGIAPREMSDSGVIQPPLIRPHETQDPDSSSAHKAASGHRPSLALASARRPGI